MTVPPEAEKRAIDSSMGSNMMRSSEGWFRRYPVQSEISSAELQKMCQ